MAFDPSQPFEVLDAPAPKPAFDPAKPFEPVADASAPAKPAFDPNQPHTAVPTVDELAQQDNGAIAAHAAANPDDFETAYQADKQRRARPLLTKVGEGIAAVPAAVVHGAQGLWNFGRGVLWDIPSNAVAAGYRGLTGDARGLTNQAQATLAAQHGEESLKSFGRAIYSMGPSGSSATEAGAGYGDYGGEITPDYTPEERAAQDDVKNRRLFAMRVQQAKNEEKLAKGEPLDTGAIAGIYHAGGQEPSEEVGPEALHQAGVDPINPSTVAGMSAASDPTMLALAAAPGLPGAATIGGGATELAGKAIGATGKAIAATTHTLNPITAVRRMVNPASVATDAAKTAGGRGLQALGDILEQQGKELRTGAPSALTTAASTAEATGERAIGTNAKRALGDAVAKGATTAAGMAPLNAALSEGDPHAFAESSVGAGMFGGAFGAFQRNRPMMVEAVRPFLRSEGARALAEAGEGNDPLAAKSAAYIMSLPTEARDSTLEAIGAIQGLPTPQGKRSKLYVLNEADYTKAIEDNFGKEQAAEGGGRGFFLTNEGRAFINGDYHSGLDPAELQHSIGHEFGGHAAINVMRAMGAKGGDLHQGLMDAAKQALFVRQPSGQYPDGTPSPDFKRFVDEYNLRFDPTGKTQRLDWRNPEAIEEFLSEQAGQQFAAKGSGELALPQSVQDRINDRIGRFLGQIVGIDTRKVGTQTHFSREEVGALSEAVRDTLSQVVGMKLRGGAEIPEPAKTADTRASELQAILDRPKPPMNGPADAVLQWTKDRAAARSELAKLQEGMQGAGTPAAGPAPKAPAKPAITSPPDVTADALKMLSVMGIKGPRANALIRMANEQHGSPILSAQHLADGAFRIHGGKTVEPGRYTPKPQAPVEPVPVPQDTTFRDELGATHKVTGAAPGAPRIGDIVATREGEIRRITAIRGDTVDTARPIDPLNARGNKVHKLADIQPLQHDYTEPAPAAPGAAPEPAKPALSIKQRGDADFIVVDAAGNPVDKQSFASETAAKQSIARRGKASTFSLPPSPNGNDIIDAIIEQGGINLSGLSKEERDNYFPHRGIWRNAMTSDNPANTPDEIARLVAPSEHQAGHGDGDMRTMFDEIGKAIDSRNQFRDQQAAEEKAAKAAQKNAPNEPAEPTVSTDAEGQDNLPPEPAVATAVSEGPAPSEIPAPLQASDVDAIAAQAEQSVTAARAGTKKKAHTAAKEITDAQVDAVAAAHEASVPANYQGVKLRRDALGKQTISGTFNPSRPFDAFLLKLADLSPKAIGILQDLQSKLGKTVTINYVHAPESGEKVTAGGRKQAQAESTAAARASGEAATQDQDKNIIPLEVRFNKGTDTPSITILGASPEKLLNNFNHVAAALGEFGEPVPYRDIHDPKLVGDMKGVARNHANGWKGDGSAKIEGFPDTNVPKADDGYQPYPIPKERFDFLNLILGDESAKTGVKGTSETQRLKQGLAAKNNVPMSPAGEVNGLREAINGAKGPVTGPDGKETTWSKATIENPLSEALRVDLVNEVKPELNNADESIREHGYKGDIGRFFAEGSPNRTFVSSGFMPDTGAPKTAQEKARERIAEREFAAKSKTEPRKEDLEALAKPYADKLNVNANISTVSGAPIIKLDHIQARKDAPEGTGTAYMKDLVKFADDNNMTIALDAAQKGDLAKSDFKQTSSQNRLKEFYGRFGFKSNYGARSYRADLPGNMHRDPGTKMSFMPSTDDSTTPGEPAGPEGQQPSGSQPDRPLVGGTSQKDTGKPEEGETPGERLMREAEAAGLAPSIETMKGVLRGDTQTMDKLRRMILDKTGRPAKWMPIDAKQATKGRIAARQRASMSLA